MFKPIVKKLTDEMHQNEIAKANELRFATLATKKFWEISKKSEVDINPLSYGWKAFKNVKAKGCLDKFNRPTNSVVAEFMGECV